LIFVGQFCGRVAVFRDSRAFVEGAGFRDLISLYSSLGGSEDTNWYPIALWPLLRIRNIHSSIGRPVSR